ncbi:MAG: class I SAM-dependent methyltransferase [Planctomycetota bacterium]|jgi:SAM-dependent methyltransferase
MPVDLPSDDPIESINRRAYDAMAQRDHFLTTPVSLSELANPLATLDARGWLGPSIRGWRVLCLAAGGGRQGPLYTAAGAEVTVLDLSPAMLERDREAARRFDMKMRILEGTMRDLSMFAEAEFDLVAHPVSTCYIRDPLPVYVQIARVLRAGGLYVSQHKQPGNVQASLQPRDGYYVLETEVGAAAKSVHMGETSWLREPNTIEYAHSLESLLGGICRSGMMIEDVSEPDHARPDGAPGSMGHRSRFIPPYLRVKARRVAACDPPKLILARS